MKNPKPTALERAGLAAIEYIAAVDRWDKKWRKHTEARERECLKAVTVAWRVLRKAVSAARKAKGGKP